MRQLALTEEEKSTALCGVGIIFGGWLSDHLLADT